MGYNLVGTVAPSARLYGGSMASVKQIQVTFDCAEPERVARFWCEVLGYVEPPPPEGSPVKRHRPVHDYLAAHLTAAMLGSSPHGWRFLT